jgi:hypothetical protein
MIDQGAKSAEQSPAGGDARRQPEPGSTPGASTRSPVDAGSEGGGGVSVSRTPITPTYFCGVKVFPIDGLSLGMLAMASGDLDTGGRVPSIDQVRRAGDAAIARRAPLMPEPRDYQATFTKRPIGWHGQLEKRDSASAWQPCDLHSAPIWALTLQGAKRQAARLVERACSPPPVSPTVLRGDDLMKVLEEDRYDAMMP